MTQSDTIECIKALSRIEGYAMSYENMERSHPLYDSIDLIMEKLQAELLNMDAVCRAQSEILTTMTDDTDIPTPEEFATMMRNQMNGDLENSHSAMDDLMVELLRHLGYGEAMDVFEQQEKWYA